MVNHLKLIKRQAYGQAEFDLLRHRVLVRLHGLSSGDDGEPFNSKIDTFKLLYTKAQESQVACSRRASLCELRRSKYMVADLWVAK